MDPNATLEAIASAISNKEHGNAVTLLDVYWQWRIRGGFEPSGGDKSAGSLSHSLADRLDDVTRLFELRRILAQDPDLSSVTDENEFRAEVAMLESRVERNR